MRRAGQSTVRGGDTPPRGGAAGAGRSSHSWWTHLVAQAELPARVLPPRVHGVVALHERHHVRLHLLHVDLLGVGDGLEAGQSLAAVDDEARVVGLGNMPAPLKQAVDGRRYKDSAIIVARMQGRW